MSGLYIHIPFCKQKCIYCNFHFSTDLSYKEKMLKAIKKEIFLQKDFLGTKELKSIYFGGGTPSLLEVKEIEDLLDFINIYYTYSPEIEITLEANPDDLSKKKLKEFRSSGINRLSIGIQSFQKKDLEFMNRAHNEKEALRCIREAKDAGFSNLSIDLIYGSPSTTTTMWEKNLEIALSLEIQHISSYCLTLEPKTQLAYKIKKGLIGNLDEDKQLAQYHILTQILIENKFIHYEISNFGKENCFSKHNTNYWKGLPYLGIGPSAHSFDGSKRQWNVSNNKIYMDSLEKEMVYFESENLTSFNKYNELIMLGLRSLWGVELKKIKKIGQIYYDYLIEKSRKYIEERVLILLNENLKLSREHWIYADKIASDLFFLDK